MERNEIQRVEVSADVFDGLGEASHMPLGDISINNVFRGHLDASQENAISDSINKLCEVVDGVCNVLLDEAGNPIDFGDSEGRKKDNMEIKDLLGKVLAVLESFPKSVNAAFVDQDRERIDWLIRFSRHIVFSAALFLLSVILGLAVCISQTIEVNRKTKELQEWYRENDDAVSFGHFLKEHEPDLWEYWYSGRWQGNAELRDSIKAIHMVDGM